MNIGIIYSQDFILNKICVILQKSQDLTFLIKYDNRKRKMIEMQVDKALCLKFPAVLRDKLLNNEIELPETTQFVQQLRRKEW